MPCISQGLLHELGKEFSDARMGGVYVQTRGPRIETRAEVAVLSRIADIVGMTLASEATLACELGIEFAAICTVDNYANGLGTEVLSYEHILETSREFADRTARMLSTIIQKIG